MHGLARHGRRGAALAGLLFAVVVVASALAMSAKPSITTFGPMSGKAMTKVTITGKNFTGATSVTFDMVKAAFKVESSTKISATVPDKAKTGKITVTTKGGSVESKESFLIKM